MKKSNRQITISENELISLIETIVNRKIKKALNEHKLRDSDDSELNNSESNNSESEEKYDDNIYDFENFIINTSDKHDSEDSDWSDEEQDSDWSDDNSESYSDDNDSEYLDWSDEEQDSE